MKRFRHRWLLTIVFLVIETLLSGCSSPHSASSVTVTTDLPIGSVVRLEAQGQTTAYRSVATSTVAAGGRVRFERLVPGEYRAVAVDANGAVVSATDPFGVGPGDASVVLKSPPGATTPP